MTLKSFIENYKGNTTVTVYPDDISFDTKVKNIMQELRKLNLHRYDYEIFGMYKHKNTIIVKMKRVWRM